MPNSLRVRGVVEGFYGDPWTFDARRQVLEFLADRGLNAYVYAPKDDPKHRHEWRTPYGDDEARALLDLAQWCSGTGVRFGMSLSPGLDIEYASPGDRLLVWEKLAPFVEAGVDWVVLGFDDVPHRPGAAQGQAALACDVLERMRAVHAGASVTVVPTDYVGCEPTAALTSLCEGLPPDVDICWTGRTVVSPTVTADEAAARSAATGGRPPLLWDNHPVNDAFMADALHLGPVEGRDAALASHLGGLLANPMPQARASLVALATAMAYASDPAAYDPAVAWPAAVADVAEAFDAPWLAPLADACASGGLTPPESIALHRHLDTGDLGAARSLLEAARDAARAAEGASHPLAVEVRPWLDQMALEAAAGLEAISLLDEPVATDPGAMLRALVMAQAWSSARRGGPQVFGPRLACYPALVQHGDGLALDAGHLVVDDASAVDRVCRLAIAALREDAP